jgi:hypothetical protein
MVDVDTFLTTLYIMVDDFCHCYSPRTIPGPEASLSESEVITLAIFARLPEEEDRVRLHTGARLLVELLVEIELLVLVRTCLRRRLRDVETLGREAQAWRGEPNRLGTSVDWRSTVVCISSEPM